MGEIFGRGFGDSSRRTGYRCGRVVAGRYTPIPGGFQPKRTKLSLCLGQPLPIPELGLFEEEGRLEVVFKERFPEGRREFGLSRGPGARQVIYDR